MVSVEKLIRQSQKMMASGRVESIHVVLKDPVKYYKEQFKKLGMRPPAK